MNTKVLSYYEVREIVALWPEYRNSIRSYNIIDFQYKVVDGENNYRSWGFWAQLRKINRDWYFKAKQGEISWGGFREEMVIPEQHAGVVAILLSDFTVKLQSLTGVLKFLEANIR